MTTTPCTRQIQPRGAPQNQNEVARGAKPPQYAGGLYAGCMVQVVAIDQGRPIRVGSMAEDPRQPCAFVKQSTSSCDWHEDTREVSETKKRFSKESKSGNFFKVKAFVMSCKVFGAPEIAVRKTMQINEHVCGAKFAGFKVTET